MGNRTSQSWLGPGVACAADSNAEAVEAIFVEYHDEIRNHVAAKFGDSSSDPDDIMQIVFERLVAHPDVLSIENPRAFLYTAARNVAIDEHRRRTSQQKLVRDAQDSSRFRTSDELTPERVLLSKIDLRNVMVAVADLPEDLREILRLNRVDGLSYTAIAKRLGVSEAAIRRRMAKILVQLHKALDSSV